MLRSTPIENGLAPNRPPVVGQFSVPRSVNVFVDGSNFENWFDMSTTYTSFAESLQPSLPLPLPFWPEPLLPLPPPGGSIRSVGPHAEVRTIARVSPTYFMAGNLTKR